MTITCEQIEQEITDKGLTAPRITLADIEAAISHEVYFTARDGLKGFTRERDWSESEQLLLTHPASPLGRLTFCVLILDNGYTVTGESACVSPENFDAELGRKIARANAIEKCWPLFGFHLAANLYAARLERE